MGALEGLRRPRESTKTNIYSSVTGGLPKIRWSEQGGRYPDITKVVKKPLARDWGVALTAWNEKRWLLPK